MSEPVLENGIPAEAEPVVEEAPAEPVAVEEPAAPAWAPAPEEWQSLVGSVKELRDQFQPVEPEPQGLADYFPTDPASGEMSFTVDGLEKYVQDQINAGVQAKLGAYEPVLNQTVAERGEALISQTFETLAKPVEQGGAGLGEFNHKLARSLAEGYSSSGYAPDEAVRRAAKDAHDFAQAERQAAIEEYKQTLTSIAKAPREPGVNGAGVLDESGPPEGSSSADRYKWVADNWAARHKLG